MDKLILKVHTNETLAKGNIIRLDSDAIEVLRGIQRESGLSFTKIASSMIRFASKYVEIQEVE